MHSSMSRDNEDRETVEAILGSTRPREWPPGALAPGTRVTVVPDPEFGPLWEGIFTGSVSDMASPEPVGSLTGRGGKMMYWIDFDQPQRDADGDGPYRKAQISDRHLEAFLRHA